MLSIYICIYIIVGIINIKLIISIIIPSFKYNSISIYIYNSSSSRVFCLCLCILAKIILIYYIRCIHIYFSDKISSSAASHLWRLRYCWIDMAQRWCRRPAYISGRLQWRGCGFIMLRRFAWGLIFCVASTLRWGRRTIVRMLML